MRQGYTEFVDNLVIMPDGTLGIGESTPDELLHIKDSDTDSTPAIKLENDVKHWRLIIDGADSDKLKLQETSDSNASVLEIAADTQVLTFTQFPVLPTADPTTDYQPATKKYVDDNAGPPPDNSVTQDMLKNFSAGDELIISSDTETHTQSQSYVKAKEIVVSRNGTLRIKFDLKTTATNKTAYGRIYRNGSPVGTEQTRTGSTAYITKSEDISGWSVGDLIQLYVRISGALTDVYTRNLRIYSDVATRDFVNQDSL